MKIYNKFLLGLLTLLWGSCAETFLDVRPYSQYSSNFVETREGAEAVLNSAYKGLLLIGDAGVNRIYVEESTTDVFTNFRGLLYGNLQPIIDFTWSPSQIYIQDFWRRNYQTIRDANLLIELLPSHPILTDAEKVQLQAEMHFARGLAYFYLYGWFGPVPLVTSTSDELFMKRPLDEEIQRLIETDLLAAATNLAPETTVYGRATKGAALGVLAQYYLQTAQWDKADAAAQQVIDLQTYGLWPDVRTLFALNNEGNSELIYAAPAIAMQGFGNVWTANALPPGYATSVMNTATQVCLPIAFYHTFEENDQRRELILTEYTNNAGVRIDLTTGNEFQNPRSLKYPLDPNQQERHGGADFPIVRYAEILLIKAEALVMAGGSIADGLYYVNLIRDRANLIGHDAADVPNREVFIDLLLDERKWEFFSEGKRRQDLLRHGRFLDDAVARGKNAKAFHALFPIPQSEMDANPELVQNDGY